MPRLSHLPLGRRLGFGFATVAALLVLNLGIGLWALRSISDSAETIAHQAQTEVAAANVVRNAGSDMIASEYAYVLSGGSGRTTVQDGTQAFQEALGRLRGTVQTVEQRTLWEKIDAEFVTFKQLDVIIAQALGSGNVAKANALAIDAAGLTYNNISSDADTFAELALEHQRQTVQVFTDRRQWTQVLMLGIGGGAILGAILLWILLTRSIRKPLAALERAAQQVVGGDLRARSAIDSKDEIGRLAATFNAMADSLTGFVDQLAAEAERDSFGTRLGEALEMADEEEAAYAVIERAMVEISPALPMELLFADSSRAHLTSAASSPAAGAPGCPVESPFSCVAVRRGNPVTFGTSEALNACTKLRGRPGGPCSAVCVPVTFMGRALGVLHAAGPDGEPPGPEQVSQLTTLATQAGSRIGTVRAFQKTQLQASTDGLTGLINRRTLENRVRQFVRGGRPFALAMCDLDHFKKLNDTHGHEAGDRALRLFGDLLRRSVRADDLAARLGGEEFALVLPDQSVHEAVEALDRLRSHLAQTVVTGDNPRFTVSIGVTDSTAGSTIEEIMRIADAALYAAKQAGRDRVEIGSPESAAGYVPTLSLLPSHDEGSFPTEHHGPAIHAAFGEEDPRASGIEIR